MSVDFLWVPLILLIAVAFPIFGFIYIHKSKPKGVKFALILAGSILCCALIAAALIFILIVILMLRGNM